MVYGIPFEPPEMEKFKEIAVKLRGNVHAIARYLKITENTLYVYFRKNPEGKEIIDHVRKFNAESDLDLAEKVIQYNMKNIKENPSIAQKAAEFTILNRNGSERGWDKNKLNSDIIQPELVKNFNEMMQQITKSQSKSALNIAESSMINETKS